LRRSPTVIFSSAVMIPMATFSYERTIALRHYY
jgi:hypothetical protein